MSPRDLVYVGHMLDMARKAVGKVRHIPRNAYDVDENLRLAHDYLGVDEDIVWQVVTEDLPKLVEALERLVPPAP
jgi:hypothetical protein